VTPPKDVEEKEFRERFKSIQAECQGLKTAADAALKAVLGKQPIPDLRGMVDAFWIFYAKSRIEAQDFEGGAAEKCAFRLAIEMRDWHNRTFQSVECKSWDSVVTFAGHDYVQARKELLSKLKKVDQKSAPELQQACKQLGDSQSEMLDALVRYIRNTCVQARDLDSALKMCKKACKEFTDICCKDKPVAEAEAEPQTFPALTTQIVQCVNAGQLKRVEGLLASNVIP